MKKFRPFLVQLIMASLMVVLLAACADNAPEKTGPPKEVTIPVIDQSQLNNEKSILDAMQAVVDARILDNKLKDSNPAYVSKDAELTELYNKVLASATRYSGGIKDANERVSFHGKLLAIQEKMFRK